ncbi:Pfam:DUF3468 [Geosmithia morbida]|uniref:Pfam:DUF3468 n=1 Tax=Geosmithia morbida TaxID=1094350 RepID=A0A9P4Z1J7_9HYPO|nr:Pfam:DUF3468 [Geosmithia morbida]KAF4126885.1 Pfam:DUF3468 [Geosmithia morbida]
MQTSGGKPCHNCRRRRLRCDRSWPTCHKCAVSGQECLGYGKVFVFTQAIDENGNLKPSSSGRRLTASTANTSASTSNSPSNSSSTPSTPNPAKPGAYQQPGAGTASVPSVAGHSSQRHQHSHVSKRGQTAKTLAFRPSNSGQETSSLKLPINKPTSVGALTDPLFQDLDRKSRYYLSYFADRVCQDLVARDEPGSNPFRELLPLTKKHPLLLQILVATSALHWCNIFRPITDIPSGLTDPGGFLFQLRSNDLVSRQALIDALTAKQKAMGHLNEVLDTLDPAGSEVALAAMHFFIKFDLLDTEQHQTSGWKAHLKGAASLLALLTSDTTTPASSRMLRDMVIADCFIYHILGSILSSDGLASRMARYAFELLPVLKRVEVNSYLSCPPEILQIILLASQLSQETSSHTDWSLPTVEEALSLIDQALEFDINAWASNLQNSVPNVADIESRMHVASAHRSAACLYILQALPTVRSVHPVDVEFLVDDILAHVGSISESDPYFKATSWPTFIAGAECRDVEKRTWTLKQLVSIWSTHRWGYIFTAIEMLKATWQMQDSARGRGDNGVNWLRDLRGLGFDHLIV